MVSLRSMTNWVQVDCPPRFGTAMAYNVHMRVVHCAGLSVGIRVRADSEAVVTVKYLGWNNPGKKIGHLSVKLDDKFKNCHFKRNGKKWHWKYSTYKNLGKGVTTDLCSARFMLHYSQEVSNGGLQSCS